MAYLRWLAAEPALARVFLIEVAAAGPRAAERRERLRDRYAELMRDLQEDARSATLSLPELPVEIFHAVAAAVDDVVVRRIRAGQAERLPELEPILVYFQVALLAGPEAAARGASLSPRQPPSDPAQGPLGVGGPAAAAETRRGAAPCPALLFLGIRRIPAR